MVGSASEDVVSGVGSSSTTTVEVTGLGISEVDSTVGSGAGTVSVT